MRETAGLRISERERALVEAAAESREVSFSAFLREAAIQQAARDLTGDPPDPNDSFGRNVRKAEGNGR